MFIAPLVSVGAKRRGALGGGGFEKGVQDTISLGTSTISFSDCFASVRSVFHQGSGSGERARGSTGERGSRTSRSLSRVLRPDVRGAESLRFMEANNRSFSPEQVCKEDSFQDGDRPVSPDIHSSGGLDVLNRPEGCLPSGSDSSGKQAVPSFPFRERNFSVQGSVFRPINCSSSVYSGDGPCVQDSSPVRGENLEVFGRLVNPGQFGKGMSPSEGLGATVMSGSGHTSQSSEVQPDPFTVNFLSWNSLGFGEFEGFTDSETNRVSIINNRRVSVLQRAASETLEVATRTHVFPNAADSSRETKNEVFTNGHASLLGFSRRRSSFVLGSELPGGPHVVDAVQASGRHPPLPDLPRSSLLVRRLGSGVGSLSGIRNRFGPLVSGRATLLHKPKGVKSNPSGSGSLPGQDSRQQSGNLLRQCDSHCLPEESGRHSFGVSQQGGPGNPSLGRGERGLSGSSVHPGQGECSSRLTVQDESSDRFRMVPESRSVSGASEEVAGFSGSLCHSPQQKVPSVLCTFQRPSGSGYRRIPSELGRTSSLCLPSLLLSAQSLEQSKTLTSTRAHSDRPLLASEGVVSGPAGGPSGTASSVTTEERSAQTAPFPSLPSGAPIASTSCLETIRRFSRHEGFSRKVARQLTLARRPSTSRVYQSKWVTYRHWCSAQGHSISKPTLPKIADFLLFLHQSKGLSASAIKGYRSMLSFVFKSRLPSISTSYVIKDLIRSFTIQRPVVRESALGWDVNKVLLALRSPPFEPLRDISLRNLTQKCLFLVALATAKRVGELQALSSTVLKQGRDLVLSYLPMFLAKTETTDNPLPRSFPLKSLGDFVGDMEEELLVCPVRCLKLYLKKTSQFINRPKSLFVSPSKNDKPLSKNAISFFLRDLISQYGPLQSYEGPGLRAHSVRSMATSLAFAKNCAVPKILEAATWRSNSVFTSFYLKELAFENGDLSSLSSFVAAGYVARSSRGAPSNQ